MGPREEVCLDPLVIKLRYGCADTSGMDQRDIEPRVLMWALAEISWQESSGEQVRTPATLEDTSKSGACVRLKHPLAVGSVVTIKWQREQFSAVARNCRREGRDFLIGVRRKAEAPDGSKSLPSQQPVATDKLPQSRPASVNDHPLLVALHAEREKRQAQRRSVADSRAATVQGESSKAEPVLGRRSLQAAEAQLLMADSTSGGFPAEPSHENNLYGNPGAPPERKDMEPKTFFPKLWGRGKTSDSLTSHGSKEVVVNKPSPAAEPAREMLSYEDIYHAAGIMNPASGYGIQKVLEMLNSERIRELSGEVKRASVLMALEVAGTSLDDVLNDATRRQEALSRYESGKKKQVEEFEAAKTGENNRIEEEMERVRAHYAERIQRNRDLVACEKEALRNWQVAAQHEIERITEVIELCRQQPAPGSNHSSKPWAETSPAQAHSASASRSS